MIRLAKKKEATAAAAASATEAAAEINQPSSSSTSIEATKKDNVNVTTATTTTNNNNKTSDTTDANSVNLFGIAGKKVKQNGDSKKPTKKRTPGEIRIQKGSSLPPIYHLSIYVSIKSIHHLSSLLTIHYLFINYLFISIILIICVYMSIINL